MQAALEGTGDVIAGQICRVDLVHGLRRLSGRSLHALQDGLEPEE